MLAPAEEFKPRAVDSPRYACGLVCEIDQKFRRQPVESSAPQPPDDRNKMEEIVLG